ASPRSPEDEYVARRDLDRVATGHFFALAIGAFHPLVSWLPVISAGHAVWRYATMTGQEGDRHRIEELQAAYRPVATVPTPEAAASVPDRKLFERDVVAQFEHFRVGEARIGHVRLHDIGAVET